MDVKYIGNMTHYLESVDLKLNYGQGALNITTDALDLIEFIKENLVNIDEVGNMLDIGAGIGTLTFMLYRHKNFTEFHAVEIQKSVYDILVSNISLNNISVKAYNMDIKDFNLPFKFKYIISNPPFYKTNSGYMPQDEIMKISKFEVCLKVSELLDVVNNILDDRGYFFLILPIERDEELRKDTRFIITNFKNHFRGKKNFISYLLRKAKND
ncbi:methyltransferase [Streptobacillus ratti]|uniref:methyltransferase n=1 Tax=Streptobacillus ratti TaxID=1720557 RepID=UPI0013013DC9|nr:methyltransferase [Streptobacillus ratti]